MTSCGECSWPPSQRSQSNEATVKIVSFVPPHASEYGYPQLLLLHGTWRIDMLTRGSIAKNCKPEILSVGILGRLTDRGSCLCKHRLWLERHRCSHGDICKQDWAFRTDEIVYYFVRQTTAGGTSWESRQNFGGRTTKRDNESSSLVKFEGHWNIYFSANIRLSRHSTACPTQSRLACCDFLNVSVYQPPFGLDSPGSGSVHAYLIPGNLGWDCSTFVVDVYAELRNLPTSTVRLIASHQGVPGSIPSRVTPGFSQKPDDAAGRRVFSGISHPPPAHAARRCTISSSFPPHRFARPRVVKSRPNLSTQLTCMVHKYSDQAHVNVTIAYVQGIQMGLNSDPEPLGLFATPYLRMSSSHKRAQTFKTDSVGIREENEVVSFMNPCSETQALPRNDAAQRLEIVNHQHFTVVPVADYAGASILHNTRSEEVYIHLRAFVYKSVFQPKIQTTPFSLDELAGEQFTVGTPRLVVCSQRDT
ncbi:hypothetical protein PR048_022569 [Dryococelus australis]|uniref:Uncharacterized protein n=1 Tax=Dryococelus australis TaxID=614101 RepID=A0ABQ9H1E1_9NEOP|nr:hypothetical protein PR048_022569 [Dryococelus australis]